MLNPIGEIRPLTKVLSSDPIALVPSPDSRSVAYVRNKFFGGRELLVAGSEVLGGVVVRCSDIVGDTLTFSPDSRRLVCGVVLGHRQHVTLDGELGPGYEGIGNGNVVFSPDSRRLAYSATVNGKCFYVVDGDESDRYEAVMGPVVFSPNSQRIAYTARRGITRFVVVDGEEVDRFEGIADGSPIFSDDSSHVMYAGRRGVNWFLCRDGTVLATAQDLIAVKFSPDGLHVAYACSRRSQCDLFIDGKQFHTCDGIGRQSLTWSADAAHFFVGAHSQGRFYMLSDGEMSKSYEGIADQPIALSGDSRRWAYVAGRHPREFIASEQGKSRTYVGILENTPIFSWDSQQIAFGAELEGKKWTAVLNGREQGHFEGVSYLTFSPDSQHLAYWGQKQHGLTLVLDGAEVPNVTFDGMVVESGLAFGDGCLSALVWKGRRVCELTVDPRAM